LGDFHPALFNLCVVFNNKFNFIKIVLEINKIIPAVFVGKVTDK